MITIPFVSFSPHLRAVPHRGVRLRRLHHPGVPGGSLLLPMSPAEAGAPAEPRPRREPPDGDHPHDPQRQHVARVLLPPVQHRRQLQLQRQLGGPGAPNEVTDQLLLARGHHEQRVCEHAHKLLCAQLSAGHPDRAPPGAVPAPPLRGLRGAARLGAHDARAPVPGRPADRLPADPGPLPPQQQRAEDVPSCDRVARGARGVLYQTESTGMLWLWEGFSKRKSARVAGEDSPILSDGCVCPQLSENGSFQMSLSGCGLVPVHD